MCQKVLCWNTWSSVISQLACIVGSRQSNTMALESKLGFKLFSLGVLFNLIGGVNNSSPLNMDIMRRSKEGPTCMCSGSILVKFS